MSFPPSESALLGKDNKTASGVLGAFGFGKKNEGAAAEGTADLEAGNAEGAQSPASPESPP